MDENKYLQCKDFIKDFVTVRKVEVVRRIRRLSEKPRLLIIQVGDEFASNKYVAGKEKDCQEVGIECKVAKLDETVGEAGLLDYIRAFEDRYDGIIVQLPLPDNIDVSKVVKALPERADVDGFKAGSDFIPCTPLGIYNLLLSVCKDDIMLNGKNVVILGRSDIVGKPMAKLIIENTNATVTVCNSHTKNLQEITAKADVLISAVGKAGIVNGDMVKEGAVVIDVGINRSDDGKLVGDVDHGSIPDVRFITPVPGGVGLLTRLSLLENVVTAAEERRA